MVKVYKFIVGMKAPRTSREADFVCDSCGCKCYPESFDISEHYFKTKNKGLCWECLKEEFDFDDVME